MEGGCLLRAFVSEFRVENKINEKWAPWFEMADFSCEKGQGYLCNGKYHCAADLLLDWFVFNLTKLLNPNQ